MVVFHVSTFILHLYTAGGFLCTKIAAAMTAAAGYRYYSNLRETLDYNRKMPTSRDGKSFCKSCSALGKMIGS